MERNSLNKVLGGAILTMSLVNPANAYNQNTLNFVDVEGKPSVTVPPIGGVEKSFEKDSKDDIVGLSNVIESMVDFQNGKITLENSNCGAQVQNGNINKGQLVSCLKSAFETETLDVVRNVSFQRGVSNNSHELNVGGNITVNKDCLPNPVTISSKNIFPPKSKPKVCEPSKIIFDKVNWDGVEKKIPEIIPKVCYNLSDLNGLQLTDLYKKTDMFGRFNVDFSSKLKDVTENDSCQVTVGDSVSFYSCDMIPQIISSKFKNAHSDDIRISTIPLKNNVAYNPENLTSSVVDKKSADSLVLAPIYTPGDSVLGKIEDLGDGRYRVSKVKPSLGNGIEEIRNSGQTVSEKGLEKLIVKAFLRDNPVNSGSFALYQNASAFGENGVSKFLNDGFEIPLGDGCKYEKKKLSCDSLSSEQVVDLGYMISVADAYIKKINSGEQLPTNVTDINSWMKWNLGKGGHVTGIFSNPEGNDFSQYGVSSNVKNFIDNLRETCGEKPTASEIFNCSKTKTKDFYGGN
jgi:hypothetical protein